MLLLGAVATADSKRDKKIGRLGIPLQYVLVDSSDLQHRDLKGQNGLIVSNGFG